MPSPAPYCYPPWNRFEPGRASLLRQDDRFCCQFLNYGKRHCFALGKVDRAEAEAKTAQADSLLMRITQGLLQVPTGINIVTFLQFDGKAPEQVPLDGPDEKVPYRTPLLSRRKIAKTPVWVFHGGEDSVVRPSRSRDMVAALTKADGKPRYTEYPDEGHGSWVPAYRDPGLYQWLCAPKKKTRGK